MELGLFLRNARALDPLRFLKFQHLSPTPIDEIATIRENRPTYPLASLIGRSDGADAGEEDDVSVRKEDLAVNHVSIEETRPLAKAGLPNQTEDALPRQLADLREQLSNSRTAFQEQRTASEALVAPIEAERFRWLQKEAAPEAIRTGVRMLVTQNGHRGGNVPGSGQRKYSEDDVRGMVAVVTERLNQTEKTLIAALEEIVDLRAWIARVLSDAPAEKGGGKGDQEERSGSGGAPFCFGIVSNGVFVGRNLELYVCEGHVSVYRNS